MDIRLETTSDCRLKVNELETSLILLKISHFQPKSVDELIKKLNGVPYDRLLKAAWYVGSPAMIPWPRLLHVMHGLQLEPLLKIRMSQTFHIQISFR